MTALSPLLRAQFKAATRLLVQDAGGGDAAAAIIGLSSSQVSRLQQAHHPDLLSISAALALAEHSGSPALAQFFATLCGARLVLVAEDDEAAATPLQAVANLMSEASEVLHVASQAMADGVITLTEQQQIQRALADQAEATGTVLRHFGDVLKPGAAPRASSGARESIS